MLKRVEALREANPMLGTRGVRLGILFPELTRMQVRAIFEAACDVQCHVNELSQSKKVARPVQGFTSAFAASTGGTLTNPATPLPCP